MGIWMAVNKSTWYTYIYIYYKKKNDNNNSNIIIYIAEIDEWVSLQ